MHVVLVIKKHLTQVIFSSIVQEAFQKNGVPTLAGIPFIETLKGSIPFVEMPLIFSIFSPYQPGISLSQENKN
jgi:hypothetical protein